MTWVRVAMVALALVEGAWMTFDGTRALTFGDYVTPSSGAHAGQLGPWSRVVGAIGIPPRSTAMKIIFVVYGLSWVLIALGLALQTGWAFPAMFLAAVATFWYLPVGTVFALVQLMGLIWLRRNA